MKIIRKRILWVSLILDIIILDQISKWFIVKYIPVNTIAWQWMGDFFRLIHVRNTGAAFSMGGQWPYWLRFGIFTVFPVLVLAMLVYYLVSDEKLGRLQCMSLAGIAGGGMGNLIDRIGRPEGVVDFLDFKFYGLFGLQRWPTFNVADLCVVIAGILLLISYVIEERKNKKKETFNE